MRPDAVPKSLRTWFVIHFIVDIAFALPLLLLPREFLGLFDWRTVDPIAARLVAAALFGIGIESYLGRNAGVEAFRNFLNLKIVWSAAATLGILTSILQSSSSARTAEWLLLLTFFSFNLLWVYYRIQIGRKLTTSRPGPQSTGGSSSLTGFSTMNLPHEVTAIAPDGSDVRVLLDLSGGGMAHFQLAPGQTSTAVRHRTVEEIWYVVAGRGEMWRRQGDREEIIVLERGVCLTIPLGTQFQFRASGREAVAAIGVTMPPWPGEEEAIVTDGPWRPSVPQRSRASPAS